MAAIHIGISGWRYMPWRGDFYPKGLPHKRLLERLHLDKYLAAAEGVLP